MHLKQDYRLLLIGHDLVDAALLHQALAQSEDGSFAIEWVTNLPDGLTRLRWGGVAIILLDLALPDRPGLTCFEQVFLAAPEVPIVVLSAVDDEETARKAVQLGAQLYFLKGAIHGHAVPRVLRSILDHTATEKALFDDKERAEITLNSIGDAVISTDLSRRVVYLNTAAERMTGWSLGEAAGQPLDHVFRIVDGVTRQARANPMDLAVRLNETVRSTSNCVVIRRDGFECAIEDSAAPIHNRRGQVVGAVMVFHDVSAARAMSLHLSHLAAHDSLTDLPNRVLLNDRLSQAIASAHRQRHRLAVLFLDLDRFKRVNDTLGHGIGDGLLQSVARRLLDSVRRSDTVSRQGGDEFVLLLSRVDEAEDAAASAQKVITALAAPLEVGGHQLQVTASIGLSMYPDDGQDADTLIRNADIAMYRAKERGRNVYQFYTPDINVRGVRRFPVAGDAPSVHSTHQPRAGVRRSGARRGSTSPFP
jgi:diguanylate cyclase (GGDEF)-like protein/PAS domain S-box-containing protein